MNTTEGKRNYVEDESQMIRKESYQTVDVYDICPVLFSIIFRCKERKINGFQIPIITKKDLKGDIEGFPVSVVQRMVECQAEYGSEPDVEVFQDERMDGFVWKSSSEGFDFWSCISKKHFDGFYEKYPHTKPREEEENTLFKTFEPFKYSEKIDVTTIPIPESSQDKGSEILEELRDVNNYTKDRMRFLKKYPLTPDEIVEEGNDNKYEVSLPNGTKIDVYDILKAFSITCPARQHAIKKLLKTGERGYKDEAQDLEEAIKSIRRAIDLIDK